MAITSECPDAVKRHRWPRRWPPLGAGPPVRPKPLRRGEVPDTLYADVRKGTVFRTPEQHENILGAIDRHRSDEIGTGPFNLGRAGRRYEKKSAKTGLMYFTGHLNMSSTAPMLPVGRGGPPMGAIEHPCYSPLRSRPEKLRLYPPETRSKHAKTCKEIRQFGSAERFGKGTCIPWHTG